MTRHEQLAQFGTALSRLYRAKEHLKRIYGRESQAFKDAEAEYEKLLFERDAFKTRTTRIG